MRDRLDDAFHSAARLQTAAFLSGCDEAAFAAVMESCELTKSTLSKSVRALEDVGDVSVRKGYAGRVPRTWVSLTPAGRAALTAHLTVLRDLVDRAAVRPCGRAAVRPWHDRSPSRPTPDRPAGTRVRRSGPSARTG